MGRAAALTVGVVLVALTVPACDAGHRGASPVSTTTTASTATTSMPPPTTTAIAVVAAASPVLTATADGILGWWDGHWVQSSFERPVPVAGGEEYTLVGLGGPITTASGSAPNAGCAEIGSGPRVDLPWPVQPSSVVGITGVESPVPRAVTLLPGDSYRVAADKVLRSRELDPADSEIVQVVRADLDGDDTDEVIVVVHRFRPDASDALTAAEDGYSVVFWRHLVEGRVHTEVVAESVNTSTDETPSPYLLVSRIAAVADLNGDGRMEVVVAQSYYEGGGAIALEMTRAGSLEEVLRVGCGV